MNPYEEPLAKIQYLHPEPRRLGWAVSAGCVFVAIFYSLLPLTQYWIRQDKVNEPLYLIFQGITPCFIGAAFLAWNLPTRGWWMNALIYSTAPVLLHLANLLYHSSHGPRWRVVIWDNVVAGILIELFSMFITFTTVAISRVFSSSLRTVRQWIQGDSR